MNPKEKDFENLIHKYANAGSEKEYYSKDDINNFVKAFKESILECAKTGQDISFYGVLNINISEVGQTQGRNPKTGESITIPPRRVMQFAKGAKLKRALKK